MQSEMLVQKREVGCCGCESHQQQGCPFSRFFPKVGTRGYGVHLVDGGEVVVHVALPSANTVSGVLSYHYQM